MYVDCGACVDPVPNGVGGSECNDGSRSVRRRRDRGLATDVGVDRNGSLGGVLGWVTAINNRENTNDTHRRWVTEC